MGSLYALMQSTCFVLLLVALVGVRGGSAEQDSTESDTNIVTKVECTTTAAPQSFTIDVNHIWAPLGAQRFVDLVKDGFFTDMAMFRCVKNFLVQFGISSDRDKMEHWKKQGAIQDDPSLGMTFDKRGMLSFAGSGPNTRTTQVFITFNAVPHLGKDPWEVPFGIVSSGMDTVIDHLYTGYGDQQPFNENGVSQARLQNRGNEYLREEFPLLSYLVKCEVVEPSLRMLPPPVEPPSNALYRNGTSGEDTGDKRKTPQELSSQVSDGRMGHDGISPSGKQEDTGGSNSLRLVILPCFVVLVGYLGWRRRKKQLRRTD